MDELIKKVDEVLNQFLREEMGSKVTQFNMKGLRMILAQTILEYKPKKQEVKKEDVKK